MNNNKIRILFFIGSLCSGGKERRLVELFTYLKKKGGFECMLVVTKDIVHYPAFYQLDIPYVVLKKQWAHHDPTVFFQFYKICRQFQPDLIHTWGRMQSLYTLPAVIGQKIPLINSQITSAPPKVNKRSLDYVLDQIIYRFSRVILANSRAGLTAFQPPLSKSQVIYNGLNMSRFMNLPDVQQIKAKYHITTPYAVVMTASITPNKNYDLFYKVADRVTSLRGDITFIGVGGCNNTSEAEYQRLLRLSSQNPRILFPGRINEVEALVNACDIGLLFSPNGEGISNAILEYMALGKPVIANDVGGNKELLQHGINGYLVQDNQVDEIADLILHLIDNPKKCASFAQVSKAIIEETFSLNKMGQSFEQVYWSVLSKTLSPAYS